MAVSEATPERLRPLLGLTVTRGDVQKNDAFSSTVAHLELHFSEGCAPLNLLLKLNREGKGREEVAFYKLAAEVEADTSMLVPCVNAAFELESGASHLLLHDVSETHEALLTRENLLALEGVPTEAHLRGVTEALARVHAKFWEHLLLDKHPAT